jgi:hypothetical protein
VDSTNPQKPLGNVESHLQEFKQDHVMHEPDDDVSTGELPEVVPQEADGRGGAENLSPTLPRQLLQEKLDQIHIETGKPFQGDLWEISDYIPQWMKGKEMM